MMKKRIIFFIVAGLFGLLSSGAAWGQKSGAGLGIILGEPTGLNGKFWLSNRTAFDAAIAWSSSRHEHSHFLFQGDFVYHNFRVLKRAFEVSRGDLPLYYGVGARLGSGRYDHDDEFGIRFVAGMAYLFPTAPFDMFVEVAPIMNLIPETELDGSAAVGVRFWFK